MALLALGVGALVLLLFAGEAFSRARVATIKTALAWLAVLAGVSLAALLLLTGRGAAAIGALIFFTPLALSWWQERRPPAGAARPGRAAAPRMSREEALEVLGLQAGANEAEIRAAWLRLMQAAHPDRGGSDWLAARINQAHDVLLGR